MSQLMIALFLLVYAAEAPAKIGGSYHTKKTLAEVEKCMTEGLSQKGDVTAVGMKDGTTLMFRNESDAPMMIDIAPPSVKVTTRFAYGTRRIVETCL